jgi:ornithine cyclodeaminase
VYKFERVLPLLSKPPDFMRQIKNEDVLRAVSLADVELVLRYAYVGMRKGVTANHQRLRSHIAGTRLSTLGGLLPEIGFVGSKTYATTAEGTGFAISLFSSRSGLPVAVLEGEAVTQLKGSVTTGLAAEALARPDASMLAMFGTGIQARAHIGALRRVRPIKAINIVSRGDASEYIRWVEREHGIVAKQKSADEAVADADIVVLATRSATPLCSGSLLKAGTFVAALGTSTLNAREVDEACVRRANLIAVEWKPQAQAEAGDLATGVDWESVRELGDVLANSTLYGDVTREIRLFKSVGLGIADVAVAIAAYARVTGTWDELTANIARSPVANLVTKGS